MENTSLQKSAGIRYTSDLDSDEKKVVEQFYNSASKALDKTPNFLQPTSTCKKSTKKSHKSMRTDLFLSYKEIEPNYEPNFEMVPYRWVIIVLFCTYLFATSQNLTYIQPVS